jgi:hypothetical protein
MSWGQLPPLAGVTSAWRQVQGGWLGLGVFLCPERKFDLTTGNAVGLWLAGKPSEGHHTWTRALHQCHITLLHGLESVSLIH